MLFIICLFSLPCSAADIYVAVNGDDHNNGSITQPKATLHAALRQARELRRLNDPAVKGGIHIILKGGTYYITETVFIRPEDAGTADSPTTIEAAKGEQPILSGGSVIKGWKKQQNNWVADAPFNFRQLWVNDKKATRARTDMDRILSWDHKSAQCWIPGKVTYTEGMEMFIHQWWAIAVLRIKNIEVRGDSSLLSFYQPESRIQSEHPWPAPWISKESGNSAFYLSNSMRFLDNEGEWYLSDKKLYYRPRKGEEMATAEVVAPVLETLVKIMGTPDNPVSYVFFKGISFQHSNWTRPSEQGHVPLQAGMYLLDAYKLKIPGTPDKKGLENQAWVGRPAAAVKAAYTNHTGFENCRFEHLSSTGLDYVRGARHDIIRGNLFRDIGGTGIQLGIYSDEAMEAHLPNHDEKEVCSDTKISNNLITNVTNEDWGTLGISAGFVRDVTIGHNEISEVNYSGISIGWGWTKTINVMKNNKIIANKIHHYGGEMYDVAGIYTLSAQPGSVISENYIDSIYKAPYAHIPTHWFYLYTDEGTSYYTVKNNWCPAEKFLQNANGPNNVWENNGPQVADSIKSHAGLEPSYQYLLKEKAVHADKPINSLQPAVVEIITDKRVDLPNALHWKDHHILFDSIKAPQQLIDELKLQYPDAKIKLYDVPFYVFDRSLCDDQRTAKEWSHTILTANLVEDKTLQKEYLQYHATQATQWPEVAKGFCNANFQRLLLYKNDRQLMLIISIPKGENLDTLNPKTTENNPKMDQWNALMKKYQEGIPGTAKGEVWVQLK